MASKKATREIDRRKPDVLRKEESIRIRVSVSDKATLEEAARRDGLGLSSWLLMQGLQAARRAK